MLAYILSQAEIDRYCAAAAVLPGGRHGACARVLAKPQPPAAKMGSAPVHWAPTPGSLCLVRIADDIKGELFKIVWRHELAHCNGWPPDHPGGREVAR